MPTNIATGYQSTGCQGKYDDIPPAMLCLALPRHQLTEAVDIAGCRTRQASLLHTDERLMSVTLHKRNELR